MLILGIETSCDETAAAVIEDGRTIVSNVVASQAAEHNLYGGVVPEIASRRHIEAISGVVQKALDDASITVEQLNAIAVTFAPGLIGGLLVGVGYAKGLAFAAQKPLVPVHHLRGHIAALYLTHPDLKPPFLCLVASGGHSHIIQVTDYTKFEVLGRTVDDAAGEAFDKVARTLKLGYPGGPRVAQAAANGDIHAYHLPTPKLAGKYDVSFSGLKTAVLNIVNQAEMKGETIQVNDMAASFQYRATEILAQKLMAAAADIGADKICIAGGVAANAALRELLQADCESCHAKLYLPALSLCGDNAAMIGSAGYFELLNGNVGDDDLNGQATLAIDYC